MEGNIGIFSVHLGSRGGENQFSLPASRLQHHLRAIDIRFNRSHRAFHDQLDAHGRGQMKDDVGLIHKFRQELAIFQWFEKIMHPVILLEVPDIFHAPGGKIIHQQDLVAAFEQTLREVRSDKTRATCDEINQASPPGRLVLAQLRFGFSARRAFRDFLVSSSRP